MTIAILGTGFGLEHGKRLLSVPGVKIAGIWGRTASKAGEAARALGCEAIGDYRVLLADPAVDLVLVCLPTDAHEAFVTEALMAGKHVFCETPLAYTAAAAERMVACARSSGRTLSVGLFWVFNTAVRHLIGLGGNGFPESLTLFRRTPPIWGRMRHIVFDLMMHDIDAAVAVAGIPETVRATGLKNSGSEYDQVAIRLSYPGKTVLIEGSSALPMGFPFSSGYNAQGKELAIEYRIAFPKDGFESSFRCWNADGETGLSVPGADPYDGELRYLIECLSSGAPPVLLSGERALSAIRIAEEAVALLG